MSADSALAMAAPSRPSPRPKIKTGSMTRWTTTPATWIVIDFLASPSDLSRALKMKLSM